MKEFKQTFTDFFKIFLFFISKITIFATSFLDEFSPAKVVKIEEFVNVCLAEDLKVMIDVSLPSNLSLEVVVDYVTTLFSKNPDLYSKAVVMSHWPHILFGIS